MRVETEPEIAATAAISCRGLAWAQADVRLSYPDFEVGPGEVVAIVGPSGSGKTTLLELLSGLKSSSTGHASAAGISPQQLGEEARRRFRRYKLGTVFQDLRLLDHLTAKENVLLLPLTERTGIERRLLEDRAHELLAALGLGDFSDRTVASLAGGEKQRVALARAMLLSPPVILADEPTGHLDARSAAVVIDLLRKSADDHGTAVLLATHDDALLPKFDRVIKLTRVDATGAES